MPGNTKFKRCLEGSDIQAGTNPAAKRIFPRTISRDSAAHTISTAGTKRNPEIRMARRARNGMAGKEIYFTHTFIVAGHEAIRVSVGKTIDAGE